MRRSFTLSRRHYASGWQVLDVDDRNSVAAVNEIAYEFATTKDLNRREELQLKLLECFHSYILKYLNMIIYGQLPMLNAPQGKDARGFLKLLLSKADTVEDLRAACKTLHLAFKDHEDTDQVYDTLAFLFMKVCAHYDPLYPKKTEEVCKYIEGKPANEVNKVADISDAVGFNCVGCIRILVRGGYLEAVQGPKKILSGYKKSTNWPVPTKYFQITSMGFVGFAQRFFRWYLRNYILDKMKEVESTADVMQLDYISSDNGIQSSDEIQLKEAVPHIDGQVVSDSGMKWSADVELMNRWKSLDVSKMNEDWVQSTEDFLFKKLSKEERYILQLVYVKELNWVEIGSILQCDPELAHNKFKAIMVYLKGRSTLKTKTSVI